MAATLDGAAPFEAIDTTKVNGGVATLWLAATGTAMVADTVNMGDDWRTTVPAWAPVGGTQDGVHLSITPNTVDWTIEESPIPAAVQVDTLDFAVAATLSEESVANLRLAVGVGTIATQAAGVGAVGKSTLTLNTLVNKFALGFEWKNALGHWTRGFVPVVMGAGTVTIDNRRAASQRLYGLNLRAVCLPTAIQIVEKSAESTG